MKWNQWRKRHEAESVNGDARSWINEGTGMVRNQWGERHNRTWPAESSRDPAGDTQGALRLPAPGFRGKFRGSALPALESESTVSTGANDTASCVHDWLWLLKLQPPKKKQMFAKTHIICTDHCRQARLVLQTYRNALLQGVFRGLNSSKITQGQLDK